MRIKPLIIVTTLISIFAFACKPCETIEIDQGPIPEKYLSAIPYVTDSVYPLVHSAGQRILFKAKADITEEHAFCEECCDNSYRYEMLQVTLRPDYPLFNIYANISSSDTAWTQVNIQIGMSSFTVPMYESEYEKPEIADSLYIGGTFYTDVYKLESYRYYENEADIVPDSLYYNFSNGILKIIMTNGETYTISN